MKELLERSAFGVCDYLGHKIGVATTRVRLYFIYISFLTLGSPVVIYLFLAFWLNVKRYIRNKRNILWE
ncbi:MAG: PspC family transcriptional regulator [Bacteroidetes bacterium]|nr:MAG: PspC family transcriptional regulator [Bacteroidota bacterium]